MRKYFGLFLIFLLGLPFMFQVNLIPFWHFSMFSAPKVVQKQVEKFTLNLNDKQIAPYELSMSESFFQGICQNYIYGKNQPTLLIQKFNTIYEGNNKYEVKKWVLRCGNKIVIKEEIAP